VTKQSIKATFYSSTSMSMVVPDMTYNVFGGTLNLAQLNSCQWWPFTRRTWVNQSPPLNSTCSGKESTEMSFLHLTN